MIKIKIKNSTLQESLGATGNYGAMVVTDKSFPGYDKAVQFILVDIKNLESRFEDIRNHLKLKKGEPIRPSLVLKDKALKDQLLDNNENPSSTSPIVIASVLINTANRKNCHRACEVVGSARHLKAVRGSGRILYNMAISWVSANLKRPVMAQREFVSSKAADIYSELNSNSNFKSLPFQVSSKYDYENAANCYGANVQAPAGSGVETIKMSNDHPINKAYFGDHYLGELSSAESKLVDVVKRNALGPANILNWIRDISYDLILQGLSSNVG